MKSTGLISDFRNPRNPFYFRQAKLSNGTRECHVNATFRAKPSNECELDVNVMAGIRPTVTADEDDHENVKMEGPFVRAISLARRVERD